MKRRLRVRALRACLLALTVAGGLVVAPGASAQAEPTETPTLTVRLTRGGDTLSPGSAGYYGVYFDQAGPAIPEDTHRVEGRLTSTGVGLPDQSLSLLRRLKTQKTFVEVDTTTTDAEGRYVFRRQVKGGAVYQVTYAGDGVTYLPTSSPVTSLLPAMRDFNATKRKVDGKLFFRGNINPGWNNRTIKLQKKACGTCAWRTVASKATGSTGAWSFRVSYPQRVGPVWRWQAVIAATGNFEKSYSAVLTTRRVYG